MTELPETLLGRKPHGLSGGQRQRVAIARALASRPELLICDESVSALDVVAQNQILALLERLRQERELAVLFITHDLSVLRIIASRVYVMNNAKVVESGTSEQIFERARDEYTKRLIEASVFGRVDICEMTI
jgi:peptide/nickel transport system ATP-binding protein